LRHGTQRAAPEVLVDRIRRGDAEAETALISQYSRPVMAMLAVRAGGDVQRAEDLHQETFLIVLKRLRTSGIDDPRKLAAFIHRTASNLLIAEYRKEARRKTIADPDTIALGIDSGSDQLVALIREEADDAVRKLIQELRNPRDRELLYRFYILQQEKPVVCQIMNLSTEHFDRVISRARKRFRELIDERNAAPDLATGIPT